MRALVTFALLALGNAAFATPNEEARQHFQRGVRLYDADAFDEAIAEFEAAYQQRPLPILLYNIAQCHRRANHVEQALHTYEMFLSKAPDSPNAADARIWVEELKHRLAEAPRHEASKPSPPLPAPRTSASTTSTSTSTSTNVPAATETSPATSSEATPEVSSRWWKRGFWALVGVSAGLVVAGIITAVVVAHNLQSNQFPDVQAMRP